MKQSSFHFLTLLLGATLWVGCGEQKQTGSQPSIVTNIVAPPTNSPSTLAARPIQFPRDEGSHYELPIEWWYLNSQLKDEAGKEYSFFFTILSSGRHLVSLFDKTAGKVYTKDYYESLVSEQHFQSLTSGSLKWKQAGAPSNYTFALDFEGLAVKLFIKSNRKMFLPGGNGFITMGQTGASHYYALTDLTVTGTINTGSDPVTVNGTGWFDHQWGQWDWVKDFSQWKWFGIKLDNGVDLMLFNLYRDKKLIGSHCGYMDATENQFHNIKGELVTKEYQVDDSGGKWQKVVELQFPGLTNTVLTLTSEHDAQFVEPKVLWEGSMKASGTFDGKPVKGTAFGELNRPD